MIKEQGQFSPMLSSYLSGLAFKNLHSLVPGSLFQPPIYQCYMIYPHLLDQSHLRHSQYVNLIFWCQACNSGSIAIARFNLIACCKSTASIVFCFKDELVDLDNYVQHQQSDKYVSKLSQIAQSQCNFYGTNYYCQPKKCHFCVAKLESNQLIWLIVITYRKIIRKNNQACAIISEKNLKTQILLFVQDLMFFI